MGKQDKVNIRYEPRGRGAPPMDTRMLSPLGKGVVAREVGNTMKKAAMPAQRGAEPRADAGATGSKVAHHGKTGISPSVYRETPGGRKGTKGKRKGEMG